MGLVEREIKATEEDIEEGLCDMSSDEQRQQTFNWLKGYMSACYNHGIYTEEEISCANVTLRRWGREKGLQRVLSFLPKGEREEEYICEECKTSPALPKMRFCVACAEVKDISGGGW